MTYCEDFVSQVIVKVLKPGTVAFDIGAHDGEHTVGMAQCCSHVYAFEAEPESALKLSNRSASNVTVEAKAATNKTGKTKLYICPTNDGGHSTSKDKIWEHEETIEVPCMKIDDYVKEKQLDHVALIKIDVEGAELEVLKGAEETIKKYHPSVVFESHLNVDLVGIYKFFKTKDYQIKNTEFVKMYRLEADQHYWAHANRFHY